MNHTTNTPPRGLILCADSRLSRLLETELAYLGVAARATESIPDPDGELCLLVADGDTFPASDCLVLAEACSCPLLLFGREVTELPFTAGIFLRRPFGLDRLEEELGYSATVLATGGMAQFITPLCKHEIILEKDLLLKGLNIIYKKNKR